MRLALLFLLLASPASAAEPTVAELVKQLGTGTPGERVIAAEMLGDRGPAAHDAATALAKAALRTKIKDENERWNEDDLTLFHACCDALAAIGPRAAPALGTVLEHDDHFARQLALSSLWKPALALAALPSLVTCLSTRNGDVLERTAEVIGRIGPKAEAAVPALVALFLAPPPDDCSPGGINGHFPTPRRAAVAALVRLGPKGIAAIKKDVIPRLDAELKGQQQPWDASSHDSIVTILADLAEPLIPALTRQARNAADASKRATPMTTLLRIGKAGRAAFDELAADPGPVTRRAVVFALAVHETTHWLDFSRPPDAVGSAVVAHLPRVLAALRDDDELTRSRAAVAFGRADRLTPDAVAAVRALLDDPKVVHAKPSIRAWSGVDVPGLLLARGGEAGLTAVGGCLFHPDPLVRSQAIGALGDRRTLAKPYLAVLRHLARTDPFPMVVVASANAAARVSLDPADLTPAARFERVSTWIFDTDSRPYRRPWGLQLHDLLAGFLVANAVAGDVPRAAVGALVEAGGGPVGLPVFLANLPDADEARMRAAMWLAELGPRARRAVPTLQGWMREVSPDVRLATKFALSRIENDLPKYRAAILRTAKAGHGHLSWGMVNDVFAATSPALPELLPQVVWRVDDARVAEGVRKCGAAAVPLLRDRLPIPQPPEEVVWLLGELGPVSREALPELRKLADGDSARLAVLARAAIRKIEGK
jgi:HEAT repeat protein